MAAAWSEAARSTSGTKSSRGEAQSALMLSSAVLSTKVKVRNFSPETCKPDAEQHLSSGRHRHSVAVNSVISNE